MSQYFIKLQYYVILVIHDKRPMENKPNSDKGQSTWNDSFNHLT